MPHLPTLLVLQPVILHVLQPVTLRVLQPVIYTFCSSVEYKSFQSEVEPGRLPPAKPSKGMIIAPAPVPSAIHRSSSLPRATPGSSITHFIHPVNQTDTHSTFITKRFVDFCYSNFFFLFWLHALFIFGVAYSWWAVITLCYIQLHSLRCYILF